MTFGARGVSVSFDGTTALRDVSVDVPDAAVIAVVGGDGAGKSTLLRTLVRQVAPDSGTVDAPGKADLGYLPASSGSWAALTVAQNLDFAAGAYGLAGAALEQRRTELLAAADLTAASDRLASQLSGGMRRKLGFLMAIVHRPRLVVLDEPSTGVDPVSRIDLWRLISEEAASGTAVVMSTTYLDEAERAGHLVVLDAGEVLVQGSYDDVRASFAGAVTRSVTAGATPVRPEWSWRRGHARHEFWPDGEPPVGSDVVAPDLEDIVIALSLERRLAGVAR
ncbi:ABC transporter ATP-binding protein [Miniimonas sp. S16]|uniref:ABC transporter ATP-binding protein n=1 Tax=Miniimonas sp. S16 TaxID=2171623 RepID=UPI000D529BF4|nr:ABC transporter ATP-binding protein [Miniimonas sp. S16]